MRRLAVVCLLASLGALAPGARLADARDVTRAPAAGAQIQLGDTEVHACRGRTVDFIVDRLRDLHVCVIYRNVTGLFVQRLKFTAPNGDVYQVLSTPFATPGVAVPPTGVDVDGVKRPATRAQAVGSNGVSVHAVLPVGGTAIAQHRLLGQWSVELSLNGRVMDREVFVLKVKR